MDNVVTYSCPNCAAPLSFEPNTNRLVCEFCRSSFTEEEVKENEAKRKSGAWEEPRAKQTVNDGYEGKAFEGEEEELEGMRNYVCPNCGAEVIADADTAATFCYYCHTPVVLTERVGGIKKPQKIIPFRFDKKGAAERFLTFVKTKKFVPKNYFNETQIENLSGVYFPFWVTDADTDSAYETMAHRRRSWRSGDYVYTEVSDYLVRRRAKIHFEDIVTSAISSEDKNMLEGILPFPPEEHKDFEMPYLLGFTAKKRNVERETIVPEVRRRIHDYSKTLLRRTVTGYTSVESGVCRVKEENSSWEYALMPVWIFSYRNKKGKVFLYAMNGYTGKLYGQLPVSIWKLLLLFLGVTLGVFLLILFFMGVVR